MSPVSLGEIKVADSRFLGFCCSVDSDKDVRTFQSQLKLSHPKAAHVPCVWFTGGSWKNLDTEKELFWDEDDEPPSSVGPEMAKEFRTFFATDKHFGAIDELAGESKKGLAVGIVRHFGERLLGVTCGRLGGCYRSIVRQTLHRRFFPDIPLQVQYEDLPENDIYGMGAGDCELILNLVDENLPLATTESDTNNSNGAAVPSLEDRILSELKFDGFKGAAGEELPRLQNLQADLSTGFIPVYRYPGNYSGDEWTTFEWSPTSLQLKQAVEERLKPLVNQSMNHCVTNYYRDGKDFIAHHGDKDLDLNREGVIVSVSLGDTRILELRRRAEPRDTFRVVLPHRSMLVLGPHTNRTWTHSILPKEDSKGVRVSLTMRDVMTFRDLSTGRLFGNGVAFKSLEEIRTRAFMENALCFGGFCAISASMLSRTRFTARNIGVAGILLASVFGLRVVSNSVRSRREEREARAFFSRTSSSGTKY